MKYILLVTKKDYVESFVVTNKINKMTTKQLIGLIDEHLQKVNKSTKKRIDRIKSLIDFLNYNLRITELSKNEKIDFVRTMEGGFLTNEMRTTLENCKTEEKKEHYIDMWARSNYFRKCAWLQYLHGEVENKPLIQ